MKIYRFCYWSLRLQINKFNSEIILLWGVIYALLLWFVCDLSLFSAVFVICYNYSILVVNTKRYMWKIIANIRRRKCDVWDLLIWLYKITGRIHAFCDCDYSAIMNEIAAINPNYFSSFYWKLKKVWLLFYRLWLWCDYFLDNCSYDSNGLQHYVYTICPMCKLIANTT